MARILFRRRGRLRVRYGKCPQAHMWRELAGDIGVEARRGLRCQSGTQNRNMRLDDGVALLLKLTKLSGGDRKGKSILQCAFSDRSEVCDNSRSRSIPSGA
jgi:hypothetical protein